MFEREFLIEAAGHNWRIGIYKDSWIALSETFPAVTGVGTFYKEELYDAVRARV